jgi:demethylspheroidene O-methyltransferase
MRPMSADDVFDLIDRYVASAAVGAALEHRLFWLLAGHPMTAPEVAEALDIVGERCGPWLELIAEVGLLERTPAGYAPSDTARTAILDTFSPDTWSFLAREARERFPAVRDLAVQLTDPATPWETQGLVPPDYLDNLRSNPRRAREFTRMLAEVHRPLADAIAERVSLDGAQRLLDVGGGSGVVSLALLRRSPVLEAVVLDVANVCAAGREIAAEASSSDRIDYRPCDFLSDDLPAGQDLTLYCDVGIYREDLLRRLRATLAAGGRLVVVGKFAGTGRRSHPSRAHWALLGALSGSTRPAPSADDVARMLHAAGFTDVSSGVLPDTGIRWSSGWTMLTAS